MQHEFFRVLDRFGNNRSFAAIGRDLGVHPTTVSRWFSGSNPSPQRQKERSETMRQRLRERFDELRNDFDIKLREAEKEAFLHSLFSCTTLGEIFELLTHRPHLKELSVERLMQAKVLPCPHE